MGPLTVLNLRAHRTRQRAQSFIHISVKNTYIDLVLFHTCLDTCLLHYTMLTYCSRVSSGHRQCDRWAPSPGILVHKQENACKGSVRLDEIDEGP